MSLSLRRSVNSALSTFALTIALATPTALRAQWGPITLESPANGSHVTTSQINVQYRACSNYAQQTHTIQVNGTTRASTSGTNLSVGQAQCEENNRKRYSTTSLVTLNPGANSIYVDVCNGIASPTCINATGTVYYDTPGITVSPASLLGSAIIPGNSGSSTFTVQNSGNVTGTAQFSVSSCVSPLVSCTVSPSSASLSPGQSTNVTVSYVGAGNGGNGLASFVASYSQYPSVTSTGDVSVLVLKPVASVTVAPNAQFLEVGASTTAMARTFASDGQELFGRTIAWSGTNVNIPSPSGASTTIIGQTPGAGSVWATSENVSSQHVAITVADGSGRNPSTLALAYADQVRDVSRCVANCFASTAAYSTPSYRSVDVERGVTLLYRSDRARPMGIVQIDATDNSATPADTLTLQLQRADGSFVTFFNGSNKIYYVGGVGVTRLAAQFDATSLSTQSILYTAVVVSRWTNGVSRTATVPARVMIANDAGSEFGAGWQVAQLQRLYIQADGVMAVSGNGSMSFFTPQVTNSRSGTWTAPAPGVTLYDAAYRINDGDVATPAWHTDQAVPGAYIQLNYSGPRKFNRLRIYPTSGPYNGHYKIRGSNNGSTWTQVVADFSPSAMGWNQITFPADSFQFWRVELTNTPGGGPWLSEAEFDLQCVVNVTCGFDSPPGEFSKLTRNGNETYTRRYPNGTSYSFDASGLLSQVADRYAVQATIARTSGRISSITDPAGQSILFYYDGLGKIWLIATPGTPQRTSTFIVDLAGDLLRATDPDGIINFSAKYLPSYPHQLDSLTDRRGSTWRHGYAVDAGLEFTYWPSAGDGIARTTTIRAPARTHLEQIAQGGKGTPTNPLPRGYEVRALVKNPRNQTTYYTINRLGSPTQVDYPQGPSSTAQYDNNGLVTQTRSPTGQKVTYNWMTTPNGGAVLTSASDAAGTVNTEYETTYDRPTHISGNTIEQWFTYNGAKLATSQTGTSPVTAHLQDAFGRDTSVTDPGGHVFKAWFSTTGLRNTDSTRGGVNTTHFYNDSYGRLVNTTAPGARDSITYDAVNRVAARTNGLNYTTTFGYDSLYLRSVTDARGKITTYTRNALGWVTQELRAGSSLALLTAYDTNGNVVSTTNRRGQTVTMQYDSLDRLKSRTTPDGYNLAIAYNIVSSGESWVAYNNGESRDTIFTDTLGRVARVTARRGASWNKRYQLAYSYNTKGQRTGISATSSEWVGEKTQGFDYSNLGALTAVTAFGSTTTLVRDGENIATTVTFPSGLVMGRSISSMHGSYRDTFNLANVNQALGVKQAPDWIGRIGFRARGVVDTVYKYSYDAAGRLSAVQPTIPDMGGGCITDPNFGFENCWVVPLWSGTPTTFTYDSVGNITSWGTTKYSVAGNRLDSAFVGTQNGWFLYDQDGNLTGKHRIGFDQKLVWNSLGQLVSDTTTSGGQMRVSTYGYDGLGRRTRRTVTGPANYPTDVRYLYDGNNVISKLDANGIPATDYVFIGVDQPFAMQEGGQTYYFVRDPVGGSVKGLVRASDNQVMADLSYSAFGNIENGLPWTTNTFWFGGKEYDWQTELVYNRARYYDPWVGRFISEDPIGLKGGSNLYAYADNDPINSADPTGMLKWRLFGIKWPNPWRDVFRWAPVAATAVIAFGAPGWIAAAKTMAATAFGSASAAYVEMVVTNQDFGVAFRRNFGLASLNIALGAAYGGGIAAADAANEFQGYVQVNHGNFGGLTLGTSTVLGPKAGLATLAHESGHVAQFFLLSTVPNEVGPWAPYGRLGAAGLLGQLGFRGGIPLVGCAWESFATWLGSGSASACY